MAAKGPNASSATFQKLSTTMFNRRSAQACAAHLLPHLMPHYRILDVGCGPGSITLDLARLVPDGHVLGIDIDLVSMVAARSSAKEQSVQNVEFVEANVQDLSAFESESFDVVHAHQVLLHLPKPLDAMREMRRLVKPGGIVSTRDNAQKIIIPLTEGLRKHMTLWDRFCHSRGADPEFGQVNHIVAHEAGFEWDKIQMSSWGWEMSGKEGREMWVQGARDGARHPLISSGIATEDECDETARAWDEWGENPEGRWMGLDGALLCWK